MMLVILAPGRDGRHLHPVFAGLLPRLRGLTAASAPNHQQRDRGAQFRGALPAVDLAQQIGADDQRELVLGVIGLQSAQRLQRAARGPDHAFHVADLRPWPQRGRHQVAHFKTVVERLKRLVKGMLEARDQPQFVDRRGLQDVQRRQLMPDVGRIEAPAKQGDAH
jgi:hypothetical protein